MIHRGLLALVLAPLIGTLISPTQAAETTYQTSFVRWRSADGGFAGWQLSGVARAADGALRLDTASASPGSDPYPPGGYNGHSYYNGGSFLVGEALGPSTPTGFAATQAIASWNAATPAGSWIEPQIRAKIGGRWTKWYSLGVWASDSSTVERHSVNLQGDADGSISVDTLVLSKKLSADALQLKLRLFSTGAAAPSLTNVGLAFSSTPVKPGTLAPGSPSRWGRALSVPQCSQMVYPDGGEVWCSPTSTSMVLGYWSRDTGPCAPRVSAAVQGVYDWLYDGHGNWPFNAAYAASRGLEAYIVRFTSLAQAEPWIAAGVPVVISYAWKKSSLDGAPFSSSSGHIAVLVGFDAAGNPIVNDPAAASDPEVQHIYNRAQLESLWLEHSGGTVYLIFPPGTATPAL
jgi:hypothetical protein